MSNLYFKTGGSLQYSGVGVLQNVFLFVLKQYRKRSGTRELRQMNLSCDELVNRIRSISSLNDMNKTLIIAVIEDRLHSFVTQPGSEPGHIKHFLLFS